MANTNSTSIISTMKINKNTRLISTVASLCLLSGVYAQAQAPADAYRNALDGISGTARAQGMSGAVGALGADPTAIWVNPAGIGLYQRGMISFTLQGGPAKSNVNWSYKGDNSSIDTKYRLGSFNNIAYISSMNFGRSSGWNFNLGAQYNNDYNYNRNYTMQEILPPSNLGAYIANRANQGTATPEEYYAGYDKSGNMTYDPRYQPLDQIVVMGMNGEIIQGANGDKDATYRPNTWVYADPVKKINPVFLVPDATALNVIEKGSKSSFDLTAGVGYDSKYFFGASLRATNISYSRNSVYDEDYYYAPTNTTMSIAYNNELISTGNLFGVNLGAMVALGEFGRLGISYLTPQFGLFEENYFVSAGFQSQDKINGVQNYKFDSGDDYMTSSYTTMLPGKLTVSAMAFLAQYGMITYDFQYRNLGHSRITTRGMDNTGVNSFIKEDLGSEFGHRLGLELRPHRSFSLRAGYSYLSSGLKAPELKAESEGGMTYEYIPSGTIVDFTLPENYQTYSAGLGIHFGRSASLDFAWVHGVKSERVYAHPGLNQVSNNFGTYPEVLAVGGKMKNIENRFVGTLTFSF